MKATNKERNDFVPPTPIPLHSRFALNKLESPTKDLCRDKQSRFLIPDHRPTKSQMILKAVAEAYGHDPEILRMARTHRADFAHARMMAMYLIWKVSYRSAVGIARMFDRHPSSVKRSLLIFEQALERSEALKDTVREILKTVDPSKNWEVLP